MSENAIQPVQISQQYYNVPHKGSQEYTGQGIPYYKTDLGLKTGILFSLPAVYDFLPDIRLKDQNYLDNHIYQYKNDIKFETEELDALLKNERIPENYKNVFRRIKNSIPGEEAYREVCKHRAKIAVPAALIATGCTVGGGMIVDAIRNNNARRTAEQVIRNQSQQVLRSIPNSTVAESGVPYYKSDIGKTLGLVFGTTFGFLSSYLNGGLSKTKPLMYARAALFALTGLLTGTVYDNVVNNKSRETVNNLS